ncbi:MAG TPA: hypothetical protein VFY96_12250 [Candidatus Binatia bacterium]|nr:hypothetical protein [Candidatus Binatia bacterium]
MDKAKAQEQQQAQQQNYNTQQQQAGYDRAMGACLEGRRLHGSIGEI